MKFEESLAICNEFLCGRGTFLMNSGILNHFKTQLSLMLNDIELMKNEDNLKIEIVDIDKKIFCADYLTSIFVEQPIDDELTNFIKAYCSFLINWNENLAKNETLSVRSVSLVRYCDGLFTFRETVSMMREILSKFKEVKDWMPPVFQASAKYLEALDNQIEQENKGCSCTNTN